MLVIAPAIQIKRMAPTPGLEDYSAQELRGREQYVAQGCVYCHSQQPRSSDQAPDAERGWGRASVASDYVYRSEEHTSELQSLMRSSDAVCCLEKKKKTT